VIESVSIALGQGEFVTLLGTNGNGKSTLLHCIMGLVRPVSGAIYLEQDGQRIDLIGKATEDIVNLGISLVPEGRRLFSFCTVQENLIMGSFPKAARNNVSRNLEFCYEVFPILKARMTQMAGTLSGGEKQMLTISRALMSDPSILLVDEASQGLAPGVIGEMMKKIRELKDTRGLSVLMTEQNFNQAVKVADRGSILVHGKIVFESKGKEDLRENELIKNYYLGID
jgi:branched-chain amino acid transport system ATP-binding protein